MSTPDSDAYGGTDSDVPGWAVSHQTVDVDVDSLTGISKSMQIELQHNFAPNYKKVAPDLKTSDFGHHEGFEEANYIASQHNTMLSDAHAFVADYQRGMQALAAAAGYMAQQYEGSDSLSATDISRAQAEHAFNPKRGDPSVTGRPGDGAADGTTTPPPGGTAPPPPGYPGTYRPM
ncbi:MAG: hypothetical protein WCA46_09190 [Actinocatenispora sp.]